MKRWWKKGPSLTLGLLLWLALTQAAVILVASAALVAWVTDRSVAYVNKDIADALKGALSVGPQGPRIGDRTALDALVAANPGVWWHVVDDRGQALSFGTPPPELRGLQAVLPALAPSDLNSRAERTDLSTHIDAALVEGRRIHLMVGGGHPASTLRTMAYLALFFTPWFALPLILLSAVAIPLSVWRATRGIHAVARQAAALDLDSRTARLAEQDVPREIRPLIGAFNSALDRIKAEHRVRERFLRDAAHEIRTPIAVLVARVEGLPTPALKAALLTDLNRLTNLAEQLLDLQRLRSPSGEGDGMVAVDLCEVARDVVSDLAPLALARGNDLVVEAPDVPVLVKGQAASLARVVVNLVQNALVHGGSPGTVTVTVRGDGSLAVSDEGAGVAADQATEIFQPFARGDGASTGHGLGLHLVDEIVKLHGGRIGVDRSASGGARFLVRLPRWAADGT